MLSDKPRFPIRQMLLHGWWPSVLKVLLYRLKGYRVGRGVRLAFGSVVLGRAVDLGDYCSIGFFSFVRGQTIRIGSRVRIGAASMLDTPHIEIGDGTKINEQVYVGGLQFPDSKFLVGRNCQIMQMTFINPARTVSIGDDSGVGGDSLLFGHTSWLSCFEGYPIQFEPIRIGNSVSLSWRVFVLPGTQIADGVVVGANSLVRGSIPPRCLAVGFPARVVSREPEFPRPVSPEEKVRLLEEILTEFQSFLRAAGADCRREGETILVTRTTGRFWRSRREAWRLVVNSSTAEVSEPPQVQGNAFLSLGPISRDARSRLDRAAVIWFDLAAKERSDAGGELADDLAGHLRRYGVRCFRVKAASQ